MSGRLSLFLVGEPSISRVLVMAVSKPFMRPFESSSLNPFPVVSPPFRVLGQAEGARKRSQNPDFKAKQAEARRLANEARSARAREKDAQFPPEEAARRAKRREASRLRMAKKSSEKRESA